MYKDVFICDFTLLGDILSKLSKGFCNSESKKIDKLDSFENTINLTHSKNPNFSAINQLYSIDVICSNFLNSDKLDEWLKPYSKDIYKRDKDVVVVCAGNIPLVGFHDILSVLASGYIVSIKPSSKDGYWFSFIKDILCSINPFWNDRILIIKEIPDVPNALIVSGSDLTISYFSNKYSNSKLLLRGSMTSVAYLNGNETFEDLERLSFDICLYSGMGCRSVTNIFVPHGYDFSLLKGSSNRAIKYLSKGYHSSYLQNRAVFTLSDYIFFDARNFLLIQDINSYLSVPPAGVILFKYYRDLQEVNSFLVDNLDNIQAIVNLDFNKQYISFGDAQKPKLIDYADRVNTLDFLFKSL